jgi:hypothetical protein
VKPGGSKHFFKSIHSNLASLNSSSCFQKLLEISTISPQTSPTTFHTFPANRQTKLGHKRDYAVYIFSVSTSFCELCQLPFFPQSPTSQRIPSKVIQTTFLLPRPFSHPRLFVLRCCHLATSSTQLIPQHALLCFISFSSFLLVRSFFDEKKGSQHPTEVAATLENKLNENIQLNFDVSFLEAGLCQFLHHVFFRATKTTNFCVCCCYLSFTGLVAQACFLRRCIFSVT